VKDAKDYRKWTAKEIESDPGAYLEAQQATRERESEERAQAEEEGRYQLFERSFVAEGGSKSDARAAYKAKRNAEASEAARHADETAIRATSAATMGRI
jgi:hypothetical protein